MSRWSSASAAAKPVTPGASFRRRRVSISENQSLLQPMPASRTKQLAEAATTFSQSLGERGREFLETRGIADQAGGKGLGEVPQDCDPEWHPYRGMLSIPYLTASN